MDHAFTRAYVPLLAFICASSLLCAAEESLTMPKQHVRFVIENDVIFQEDNDYTNGVRFDYARKMDEKSYWGISLTQNMYTPYTNGTTVKVGEHPYAGHLALGGAYITQGERFGTSTEFQIGVTGDLSLARYTQRAIHGIGNLFQWRGWDQQVPAEITFQLSSRQDYDLETMAFTTISGWESDSMIFARQEVGTVNIRFGAGYAFRFGKNLPPYSRHLGNKNANYGVSSLIKPNYDPCKSSYFFVASVFGEYVARDLSIEGGVLRSFESTASVQPWQAELQMGVGVVHKNVNYFAGFVYHGKQFRTQDRSKIDEALTDFYGVLSVGWSF